MASLLVMLIVTMLILYTLVQRGPGMVGNKVQDMLNLHDTACPDEAAKASAATEAPHRRPPPIPPTAVRSDCKIIEEMKEDKVVVVMRTGATEAYTKLPTQLLTTLRCFEKDEFLLYSDLEDTVAQFKIENILQKVPEAFMSANHDFEVYRQLQAYKAGGLEMGTFPVEMSDQVHPKTWTLDKYKFMHMLEDAYHSRPDGRWYVFIETDTYMVWSNLLRYLHSLNPAEPLYLGSAAEVMGQPFAHGGSGFVISRAALDKIFGGKERGYASTWDEVMINECCGDYVVGLALFQADVNLHNIWPMINGEYPATMPFGPNHWCQPIMSMHHIPPPEMSSVWRFEQERGYKDPMQIKELYFKFVEPHLRFSRVALSWDNLSNDILYRAPGAPDDHRQPRLQLSPAERQAHRSGENCELACKGQQDCFQWLWKSGPAQQIVTGDKHEKHEMLKEEKQDINGKIKAAVSAGEKREEPAEEVPEEEPYTGPSCTLDRSFKLGSYVMGRENQTAFPGAEQWISGWDMESIDKWVEQNQCPPMWVVF